MLQYQILETGFFYADGGAMFGAIPKKAWNRRYDCDDQNCCKMAMRCLLAWNDKKVILFDTGVGNKSLGKLTYYRFHDLKNITELIHSCGFEPEQVTDVVLSHLHFDHCGGCTYQDETGTLKITFPNALHWFSKVQWENYLHPNYLEQDTFRKEDIMPVFESGLVRLVEKEYSLCEGLRFEPYDGHTDGQLVVVLETGDGKIVCPGDVIPTKAHCSIDWLSAYDIRPLCSIDAKNRLMKETEDTTGFMIFYHDAYNKAIPFGTPSICIKK